MSQDDQQDTASTSAYGVLGYEGEMDISDNYQQQIDQQQYGVSGNGGGVYGYDNGTANGWHDGHGSDSGLQQESLYDSSHGNGSASNNDSNEEKEAVETERAGRATGRARGKGSGRTGRGRNRHR